MYNTHITPNGALCHDRSTSVDKKVREEYIRVENYKEYHLCYFGPYDNYREEWVNAGNIAKNNSNAGMWQRAKRAQS